MPSNASPTSTAQLKHELKIRTLIDLRSLTELKTDETLNSNGVYEGYEDVQWSSVRSAREVGSGEFFWRGGRGGDGGVGETERD